MGPGLKYHVSSLSYRVITLLTVVVDVEVIRNLFASIPVAHMSIAHICNSDIVIQMYLTC